MIRDAILLAGLALLLSRCCACPMVVTRDAKVAQVRTGTENCERLPKTDLLLCMPEEGAL